MKRKFAPFALALPLLALAAQAHAVTTVLSFPNVTTTGTNVGTVVTNLPSTNYYTNTYYSTDNYHVETTHSSTVITAPTNTTAGLAYDYETVTQKYTEYAETRKYSYGDLRAVTDGTQYTGGKSVVFEGSVSSTIATTITLDLSVYGKYLASSSPFGVSTPALPTLYFGSSLATLGAAPLTYGNSNAAALDYGLATSYVLSIAAGQTINFAAAVFAPADVSISEFRLYLESAAYDYQTTSTSQTGYTHTSLIGAHILSPTPEPETYAMLLTGIGLIALRRRRPENTKLS